MKEMPKSPPLVPGYITTTIFIFLSNSVAEETINYNMIWAVLFASLFFEFIFNLMRISCNRNNQAYIETKGKSTT